MRRDPGVDPLTNVTSALETATADLDAPLAALHLPSLRANLADLRRRAAGTRASGSRASRCARAVLREVLGPDLRGDDTVRGIMAYSLSEALWLVESGCDDVLMGYPTVDRSALRELGADAAALAAITLMVDDVRQLEIARDAGAAGARVCVDVDCSLRVGPVHLGVRRSPLRDASDVEPLVRRAAQMGFRVVGAMFYEAQVARSDNVGGSVWSSGSRCGDWSRYVARWPRRSAAHRRGAGDHQLRGTGGRESGGPNRLGVTAIRAYARFRQLPHISPALVVLRAPGGPDAGRGLTTFLCSGYVASGSRTGSAPCPAAPWAAPRS